MIWIAVVFLSASILRVAGISYGLPAVFNADEPHVMNVAMSFGRGSLHPILFKYPTLWMYVLFAAQGAFYLVWSCAGLRRGLSEFGALFIWNPTPMYLLGRLLAAACSVVALERVLRAGAHLGGGGCGLWAAALLAVSPVLVVASHSIKPESLMFFLSACSWAFAARYWKSGMSRDIILCGFMAGLAASAQYTAFPLFSLPIAAWVSRRLSSGSGWDRAAELVSSGVMALAGFLLGTPYALLDYRSFWSTLQDIAAYNRAMTATGPMIQGMAHSLLGFAGPWLPGGALWLTGAIVLCRSDRSRAILLLAPLAVALGLLSRSPDGSSQRYFLSMFPSLALTAAIGLESALLRLPKRDLFADKPAYKAAVLAALMLPGAWRDLVYDRELLLPDTRSLATNWIEGHIPQGTRVLIDQEHASPRLKPSRDMVDRLLAQTEALGHPKARYYSLMRESHPGGGYDVYQVRRSARDLRTFSKHAAFSESGRSVLDVAGGLAAVRKAGIGVVVLTSEGVDPAQSPELARFLSQVRREGRALMRFVPEPGKHRGPRIEVYRIRS